MRRTWLLLAIAGAAAAGREGVPILYSDPRGRTPSAPTAEQLRSGPGYEAVTALALDGGRDGKVVVIVDDAVYEGISGSIATYCADLASEGWTVETWVVQSPTAAAIRADLQDEYAGGGLEGALLVGDLPAGWVEDGGGEYPVDVYLMDMNGTWQDSDSDGLFDGWTSWGPEIWVGRLTPTWLSFGTSEELLQNYFAKNHAYRSGTLSLPDRALAYEEAFTGLTYYLDLVYDDVLRNDDPAGTNADDFRSELLNGYEWVHLISHSSPWGSSFHTGAPPAGAGTFNSYEAVPLDPHAFFYVLNCCTNGRWTEIDNLANCYIWADTYGLVALAQAKTDYTNDFQELYQDLATGQCIGHAFRIWLAANMGLENAAVLLGDPTLRPHGNASAAGVPGHASGGAPGLDWSFEQLTAGLHSEGDVSVCLDPSTGETHAAFGTSAAVRANILATRRSGGTWIEPAQICYHEYWDWHPALGSDGEGSVFLAWHSMRDDIETYDIFVTRWNGSSWSAATQLTDSPAFEVEAAVAGASGRCWVVWQQWSSGQTDICGRYWTGSAWTTQSVVSGQPGPERAPAVTEAPGGYTAVYIASRAGSMAVCARDAPDSGPFGAETILSGSGDCREPAAASDGASTWAAWESGGDIWVRERDAGGTWLPAVRLSYTGAASRPAVTSPVDGTAAVAWMEDGQSVMITLGSGTSWSAPAAAYAGGPVESVGISGDGAGNVVLVLGARNEELHWDILAAESSFTGVEDAQNPQSMAIAPVDNPAGSSAGFVVTAGDPVQISLFDIAGRLVRSICAVPGTVVWDRMTNDGARAPAGVYFARIEAEGGPSCRFVLL